MNIKNLQIQFWYHYIAYKIAKPSNGKISAYQLEDIHLTEHEKNIRIKNFDSNRWYRYKKGANMPNTDLITRMELKVKGSSALIKHPFWDILKTLEFPKNHDKLLVHIDLTRLDSITQKTILTVDNKLKVYTGRAGSHISQRDTFDSISALILFIFQIQEKIRSADQQMSILKSPSTIRKSKKILEEQLVKIVYHISRILLLLGMKYLHHPALPLLKEVYSFIYQNLLKDIPFPNNEIYSYQNVTGYIDLLHIINKHLEYAPKDMPPLWPCDYLCRCNYILPRLFSQFNFKQEDIFITEKKP